MLADGLYTIDELYSREVGIFLVFNLVVPPLTILGAIVVWTVVWWKTGKKRISSEQNAKPCAQVRSLRSLGRAFGAPLTFTLTTL
jgi:hypothetical protein